VIEDAHEDVSSAAAARERAHEVRVHLMMLRRAREPRPLDAATELILRRLLT
jgi:hypothetical protein